MLGGSSLRAAEVSKAPPDEDKDKDEDELVDTKKIGYLIRPEERNDIESFLAHYPAIASDYIPVAVIGEGFARFAAR